MYVFDQFVVVLCEYSNRIE